MTLTDSPAGSTRSNPTPVDEGMASLHGAKHRIEVLIDRLISITSQRIFMDAPSPASPAVNQQNSSTVRQARIGHAGKLHDLGDSLHEEAARLEVIVERLEIYF